MGCCSVELSFTNLVLLGALYFVGKKLLQFYRTWKIERMFERWDKSPKDKVILHTVWRGKTLPSISPYALKLETYLRIAKIPYELETKDYSGAKGKLPWITYNGQHVADSQLIIQFLNKKLGINLNKNATVEQQAVARACRMMLEEHFVWGLALHRWVENVSQLPQLLKLPFIMKLFLPLAPNGLKGRMDAHGIGKHSTTEIYQMTEDDLHTLSALLGQKKFLGGDEPCEDDCAVFGMVAQAVWASPGSSYEKLVHGELHNLKQYSERMRDQYWKDWNDCIDRS